MRRVYVPCSGFVARLCSIGMSGYTNVPFNRNANHFLEHLQLAVEAVDSAQVDDVSLSDGVLNIETTAGTFVVNKQAPKMQLWLSSPISGPLHYDMRVGEGDAVWVCDKDGHDLRRRLEEELRTVLQMKEFSQVLHE